MTLYLFNKMTPQEQLNTLKMLGAFVASRRSGNKWFLLFQIDAFYVETLYDRTNSDIKIERSFKTTNALKPYLEKINLEALLSGI